jgi:hypothetical protein
VKVILLLALIGAGLPVSGAAQDGSRQQGTIIKMHLNDCISVQHGLMAALSGTSREPAAGELCPEYVLVTDTVVYTIMGKSSNDLLPLAETTRFRFQKNQLFIRIDDAKHESRFDIREMVMRSEWERSRKRQEQKEQADERRWRALDSTVPSEN